MNSKIEIITKSVPIKTIIIRSPNMFRLLTAKYYRLKQKHCANLSYNYYPLSTRFDVKWIQSRQVFDIFLVDHSVIFSECLLENTFTTSVNIIQSINVVTQIISKMWSFLLSGIRFIQYEMRIIALWVSGCKLCGSHKNSNLKASFNY